VDFILRDETIMTAPHRNDAASSAAGYAGDVPPGETWNRLVRDAAAQLVDVRTSAEWNFVGVPNLAPLGRDALFCEWQHFPSAPNPEFVQEVIDALKQTGYRPGAPLFFLCRSGGRSRAAAIAMTEAGYGPCFNVAEGFEGRLDSEGHRGKKEGWKASGLPWVQG
jgi:rhodanese-related sulfurtransferase